MGTLERLVMVAERVVLGVMGKVPNSNSESDVEADVDGKGEKRQ